jgi:hypothetical protein
MKGMDIDFYLLFSGKSHEWKPIYGRECIILLSKVPFMIER